MPFLRLIGLIIGLISLVLKVISLAIPYWIYFNDEESSAYALLITANIGFWEYCLSINFQGFSNGSIGSICGKLYESDRTGITDASAAMLFLGMLLIGGSVVVCGLSLLYMKESKVYPIVGGVFAFIAGACTLIGVALYGYEYWQKIVFTFGTLRVSHMYGPSFYMAIVATVLALASGGIQIAGRILTNANRGLPNVSVNPTGTNMQNVQLSSPYSWHLSSRKE